MVPYRHELQKHEIREEFHLLFLHFTSKRICIFLWLRGEHDRFFQIKQHTQPFFCERVMRSSSKTYVSRAVWERLLYPYQRFSHFLQIANFDL